MIEVLITLAIIAILVAVAMPSYQDTIQQKRLKEAVESLRADVQLARTEALKRSQNVVVSRTSSGNAGDWCYGLNLSAACDCTTAGSCSIKRVQGGAFSSIVSMASGTATDTFDFRRGTANNADSVTFSTSDYSARVEIEVVGRARICTPPSTTGLPGYPGC